MQINVRNGTRAGWKTLKAAVTRDWRCPGCKALLRYYWRRCPSCGHARPE